MKSRLLVAAGLLFALSSIVRADPQFRVIAMAETGGIHGPYVAAAHHWLNDLAAQDNFTIDYISNANKINDEFLSHYQVFIQLNYPPYNWNPVAMAAFEKSINEGRIGWIGFHHATLLGEFDGFPMWPWFSKFMGGIRFQSYIPNFAAATVDVEDRKHPIMQGVSPSFFVKLEEWYTWDKDPRPNVHVIASVDESTYKPDSKIKMGDHPVIWSNEHVKARNVYIFMGHSPILLQIPEYRMIFRNAIYWAAGKPVPVGRPIPVPAPLTGTASNKFNAIAFYSTKVEKAHVQFAKNAIAFYTKLAAAKHFTFDTTTDWNDMNSSFLSKYQVVLWLDDFPHTDDQRQAFRDYMENGGAWIGCHVAGYNDKDTHWPWFVQFMGGAVFYENNWPPLPAKLKVDTSDHPVTQDLPPEYDAPANEYYRWIPSPRLDKDVKVLVTLDPSNYPFGKKDFIRTGDVPVVWTNTKYRMVYINMGHGDKVLTSDTQNKIFENALLWLGET